MAAFRVWRRAGRGIDLHRRDPGTGRLEIGEALHEAFDFGWRRFGPVDGGEETLNDDGPLAAHEQDVLEDFFEGNLGAVDLIHPFLRADLQLDPDLVASGEVFETGLDLGPVESGPIGDEDDLEGREPADGADVNDGVDGFHEFWAEGGLAVAAERDVLQHEQFRGKAAVEGQRPELLAVNDVEGLDQFLGHQVNVELGGGGRGRSIHLAVDAIKVAEPVGIQIDPNRESAGTG